MSRCFAIIPAAGHSTRMGQPKLLLPLTGKPLILHTIDAWRRSQVERIVVVVRPGDDALAAVVQAASVELVVPGSPPPDMKASVLAALDHLAKNLAPVASDAFLVAPADMPRLSPAIIDRLIDTHRASEHPSILLPMNGQTRGHPVLFPWELAAEVPKLREQDGLNALQGRTLPRFIACEDLLAVDEQAFADIDTPADWRRLAGEA